MQETELSDVSLFEREKTRLDFTIAKIHPFKDFPFEEKTGQPLIYQKNGTVMGYEINQRGALVKHGCYWFRYKGYRPIANARYDTGEPNGGMSKRKAIRQLESEHRVNAGFEKYGYNGPYIPAGFLEYDVPFFGENACCAVSKTFGDTRLNEIWSYFYRKPIDNSYRMFLQLTKNMHEWTGFALRILRETQVVPSSNSLFMENYALFRTNGGYGISKVDFGSAEFTKNDERLRDAGNQITGWLSSMSFPFNAFDYAARLRISPRQLMEDIEGILVDKVARVSDERIEIDKKTGEKTLYVAKARIEKWQELEDKFWGAFDGKSIPKPIDMRLVNHLVTERKVGWLKNYYW